VRLSNRTRPGNSSYRNLGQLRTATCRTGNPAALHGLGRLFDLEHFIELLEETRYVVCPAKDTHLFALELPDSDAAIVRDDAGRLLRALGVLGLRVPTCCYNVGGVSLYSICEKRSHPKSVRTRKRPVTYRRLPAEINIEAEYDNI
jgi:hypothetical protein